MVDVVDAKTRSRMMAGIRGRDTQPELKLRRALHARGYRYKLYVKNLPGKPDMVFPRYRTVLFVHGCFWHRHENCRFTTTPATRPDFWAQKFERNVLRDEKSLLSLEGAGWRTATIWECAIRDLGADKIAKEVGSWHRSDDARLIIPYLETRGDE